MRRSLSPVSTRIAPSLEAARCSAKEEPSSPNDRRKPNAQADEPNYKPRVAPYVDRLAVLRLKEAKPHHEPANRCHGSAQREPAGHLLLLRHPGLHNPLGRCLKRREAGPRRNRRPLNNGLAFAQGGTGTDPPTPTETGVRVPERAAGPPTTKGAASTRSGCLYDLHRRSGCRIHQVVLVRIALQGG